MFVISLTTIPSRFKYLNALFSSINRQVLKPDKVILNIPHIYNRFKKFNIEELSYLSYPFLEINRCNDFGPATKIIPTLEKVKDEDIILFIDDDRIPDFMFTNRFIENHKSNPDKCIAGLKYYEPKIKNYMILGCGGVLIKRKMFENHKYNDILKKCPHSFYVDDIVLSMLLIKNNIEVESLDYDPRRARYEKNDDLYSEKGNFERFKSNDITMCFLKKEFDI